jgi:DNA-binding response OmpR family regulator
VNLSALRAAPVILVVDDDEYVHSTLSAALRGLQPDIIQAMTAADGLRLALDRRPNLAIIDVGLPDLDGYALTRSMRARPELTDLRICILTGHRPDQALADEAGANAILAKPFRLAEFVEVVRSQLRLSPGT